MRSRSRRTRGCGISLAQAHVRQKKADMVMERDSGDASQSIFPQECHFRVIAENQEKMHFVIARVKELGFRFKVCWPSPLLAHPLVLN